jgi:hypothetical protein
VALVPASKPATAAPVMRNLVDFVISWRTPIDFEFTTSLRQKICHEDHEPKRSSPRLKNR